VNNIKAFISELGTKLDGLLDHFTTYRLVLYFLLALLGWGVLGSFFDQVPYSWHAILASAAWLVAVCWIVNKVLSRFLDIPANNESDLITALILALILSPASSVNNFLVLAAAGAAAIASKYLITLYKSHLFNPAAAGAFVAGAVFHQYASWWVGTKFITPLVVIGGILILRKMKRFGMVAVFLAVFGTCLVWSLPVGSSTDAVHHLVWLSLISTPVLFLAVVMLTEPLTSPPQINAYLAYAIVVGLLYSLHRLHFSPEEALLAGNAFAFLIAPRRRYKLQFISRTQEADEIYSYKFRPPRKINFKAGQYMEWTIAENKSDSRGNRRYLTISSSPTESEMMFTIKHPKDASAFKKRLDALKPGDAILASYLAGSFNLPPDASKKMVFMAGGVGITPFRSMIKYLVDSRQKLDATLIYSVNKPEEIAFRPLFAQASTNGLKSFYTNIIDKDMLAANVPDYHERTFYISGPYGFVRAMEKNLLELGVGIQHIVTDYFPGYGG